MNKKGEIDKAFEMIIITTMVVVILIFFVLFSGGLLLKKNLSDRTAAVSATHLQFVFDKVSVKNQSGQFDNYTLVEAFRKYKFNEEVKQALKEISLSEGCSHFRFKAINRVNGAEMGGVVFENKVEKKSRWLDDFFTSSDSPLIYYGNIQTGNYTFSFLTKPTDTYVLETYSGECLNE